MSMYLHFAQVVPYKNARVYLHDRVVEKVDSLEKTMFFLTSLTGYRFHLARVSGYECYCWGTLLQVFQTYMM